MLNRISKGVRDTIENIEELDQRDKYYAMLFLENLNIKTMYEEKENEKFHGFINKSTDYFREVRGGKDEKAFVEILAKNNLIEINHVYSKERFSKSYKSKIVDHGGWVTVKAENYMSKTELRHHKARVEKRIKKYKDISWHRNNIIKYLELCLIKLEKLYITKDIIVEFKDKKDLEQKLLELDLMKYSRSNQVLIRKTLEILDIENSYIIQGKYSNRHFHALSNAPKCLRACLKSKLVDRPLVVEIDVSNSQPTILMILIKAKKLQVEQQLFELTEQGKFYESLGKLWGFKEGDITDNSEVRHKVKRIIYGTVLFAEDRNNWYFKKVKKFYPKFSESIEKLDKDRTLARELQRLEVDIMIPTVKKHKAVGIHDSVILTCTSGALEVEIVKSEIEEKFKKRGVKVTLKTTYFD